LGVDKLDNRDINQIACHGRINLLKRLAAEIANSYEVEIVKEPSPVLVMMRVEESVENTIFNAGEIFAIECEVKVNGVSGFSCIINENEYERAYYAALLSAVFKTNSPLNNKQLKALKKELDSINRKRSLEFGAIKSTKVKFEVMEA
jgi:alpha-D-ribose 1-methylphosphonate 5-triphosphate synthase subunit PhnG